ncbi:hypothetical protein Msil_1281 [Methylocella silvestris BL2]|uniref:Uncharacterized protein n=1 Tax=Methylocella silvestris (strain DSM 15510 / CIP 108128 / LMG 27833 / NCIMB 13906 / BL2) TaxID=395965 RepID=B8ER66_METSB|nr:hypothetical protein Msil_1281 [Methylocella silvestris BL2]
MAIDRTTYSAVPVTASWARVSIAAHTVTNPQPCIQVVTNGDAVSIDAVQAETGAIPRSPIITATAATAARQFDNVTFAGTGVVEGTRAAIVFGWDALFGLIGNSASLGAGSEPTLAINATNANCSLPGIGSLVVFNTTRSAGVTYHSGCIFGVEQSFATDNGAAPTSAATASTWAAPTTMGMGVESAVLFGHVRSLAVYGELTPLSFKKQPS